MCSTQTTDIRPSFGDAVRLNGSRAGRVRFIGHTKFQKNTLLYGIHLKQAIGKHNGTVNNIKYFKCPSNHGVFVSAENIIKIIKKHTASNISFYYNQIVKVSNIGIGRIQFIGMTNFGNNYWYGIKLKNEITKTNINDNCIHYLQQNQINIYFNANYTHSIFVRSNQLQSVINPENNTKFNKKNLKLYMKSKSTNGEYKNNKKHKKHKNRRKYKNISENEANITHVNESMVSMMNSLNIPKHSHDSLMGLKKEQKLLLIQQWFITPNHERRHSDPTTPISTVSNNVNIYESKSIDMGFDEYECCISNGKQRKKKLKRKKKVIVKSVKNNRKDKKKKIIKNNNIKSKSKPRLKLKKDSSKQRSKTMMPKHKKKHKHKKKIIKNKIKKKSPKYKQMSDDEYIPKYKPIFRNNYSHSEEYYW